MRAEEDRLRQEAQGLKAALLALSAAAAIRATSHRLTQITHFIDGER